ncbi:hypothetical protein PC9H_003499 [Pleurotus ostreatus]|uniref:WW domain-containing protein n=1 Tax=Pleurotus ostreatus TaxID=5322 RepID=A0A8H7A2M5_PLEOS|nr:uncharacterized protein PC9H_003499 [Pleurotus ostreatus]KAF7436666.1 hypothetical protein PC9H_003499 [Pleurotus ostreatus]
MEQPLPEGWKKEYDPSTQRHFYVDTKATPPRSIWVHPHEDEQYLKEHPEKRDTLKPPPPYEEESRRHSWNGNASSSQAAASGSKTKDNDRGTFGKFKDKLIGTKEEREAKRKEQEKLAAERRKQRQQLMAERNRLEQEYLAERMRQQRAMYNSFPPRGYQTVYTSPGPFTQQPFGYPQRRRGFGGGGFGGGGIGLPLVGGLAGGLLLGELFDNDHGDFGGGGDYGGGGFDGGGGDFGGGSDF